jgi:hypothetical protein
MVAPWPRHTAQTDSTDDGASSTDDGASQSTNDGNRAESLDRHRERSIENVWQFGFTSSSSAAVLAQRKCGLPVADLSRGAFDSRLTSRPRRNGNACGAGSMSEHRRGCQESGTNVRRHPGLTGRQESTGAYSDLHAPCTNAEGRVCVGLVLESFRSALTLRQLVLLIASQPWSSKR